LDKKDFWWILWGILVAFGLQVLYDIAGDYPQFTGKAQFGLAIEAIFLVGLFTFGYALKMFANSKPQIIPKENRK
jgi:hypothetical protein